LYAIVLALGLLLVCAGCGQGEVQELAPERPEQVEIIRVDVPGDLSSLQPFNGGFLAQSYVQPDGPAVISMLDSEGQALWTCEVEGYSEGIIPVGGDQILLKGMRREYTALDGDGNELWRRQVGDDHYVSSQVYLPDHAGGVYFFGRDTHTDQCQRLHISAAGEVRGPEPYTEIPNCSVLSGWAGEDGEYWLEVISGGSDEPRRVVRMDEALRPLARFELKKNQYPQVVFYPETNQIVLYGQAYRGSGVDGDWHEYGFLYEIDDDCKQVHYESFEGMVPGSVARLKDGRWVVSFYTRENAAIAPVYLYSADWKQKTEININYGFTGITALDDGGFVILGAELAAGQPEAYLFMSSVRPKMDVIYSRYSAAGELLCEKTFYAGDSKSGYGVYVLVDAPGRVLTD